MKFILLLTLLLCATGFTVESRAAESADEAEVHRDHGGKRDGDAVPGWYKGRAVTCSPEMRGRCGKRRGDLYGARQPVTDATEARKLLLQYFAGEEYTVSEVTERRWGFKAEIIDKDGTVVDRVMIDKRSGRIRSLY
ncbi:MAG: hypothetical protein ACYDG4_07930 [Desulfuromonadaceae bacterium]